MRHDDEKPSFLDLFIYLIFVTIYCETGDNKNEQSTTSKKLEQ